MQSFANCLKAGGFNFIRSYFSSRDSRLQAAARKDGEGSVAWESRRVKVAGGSFEDDFKGFGVHVYRFAER